MSRPPASAKTAIVLSGGGANGAYEVGVLKALLNGKSPATDCKPPRVDAFIGTSIGSFNAAFMAAQWDEYGPAAVGNLERVWIERLGAMPLRGSPGTFRFRGDPTQFLRPRAYVPNPLGPFTGFVRDTSTVGWSYIQRMAHLLGTRSESLLERVASLIDFATFLNNEPWQETIRTAIDFSAIRRSHVQLRVAATNWSSGEVRLFSNWDMTDQLGPLAIECSSALPGAFSPVMIGSEPHVDGAVLMNTPLRPAIRMGATEIHVVYLDPDVRSIPLSQLENTLGTLYRMNTISWAAAVNNDIKDAAGINKGIELLELAERGELPADLDANEAVQSISQVVENRSRYSPLTIHRHHPRYDLGGGAIGLLNFSRARIREQIDRGFADAVQYDAEQAGAVIPRTFEPPTRADGNAGQAAS